MNYRISGPLREDVHVIFLAKSARITTVMTGKCCLKSCLLAQRSMVRAVDLYIDTAGINVNLKLTVSQCYTLYV